MQNLVNFIKSIHDKKKIRLNFYSKQDNSIITRLTAPMDYAPSLRAKDKSDRFHFWDYEIGMRKMPCWAIELYFIHLL